MNKDQLFMNRALELASLGIGYVAPNPMVGCVIVFEDKIIGEGWHQKYGHAHAEVNAINSVKEPSKLSESTVYVSLEPCSHFGKTPPCADLLIEKKVKKVVICNVDPNPLVAGKGIDKLKAAGIEIITGILEEKGKEINKRFFTFIEKKRPYIILKWAQTANGFIAGENGEQIQISNEFSSKLVHKMRAYEVAIMVGTNTAIGDNPSLTSRKWVGKNPIRILIDRQLRFKKQLNIFNDEAPTFIYNLHGNGKIENAEYIQLEDNSDFLKNLVHDLYSKNIQSVMVEGGAKLLESFLDLGLWDEALIITNNRTFEKGKLGPKLDLQNSKKMNLNGDLLHYFQNSKKID